MNPRAVLLAEDDEDDAFFLTRAFERVGAAVQVAHAFDGGEALRRLREPAPPGGWALVVLDLKMPRVGGLEALAAIRASPALRALPVAILTASAEPHDRAEAERLAVALILRKPRDTAGFDEVARRLASLCGAAA